MYKRTLYISDLDGTLLNQEQRLTPYTINTINSLVAQGMIFSYATARSSITAAKATTGLTAGIPIVVYNGTFVLENGTNKRLLSNLFTAKEGRYILDCLLAHQVYPIVYTYIDQVEKFLFAPNHVTFGMAEFLKTRESDIRRTPVDATTLYQGDIFYYTCIDTPEKLYPLYLQLKERFQCIYHKDIYSGEQWLEIQPAKANKANAVLLLKEYLHCEKVVCFGDALNDLSMFHVCDECYAVENAVDELKQIATGVIGSNREDGVAKWLAQHFVQESLHRRISYV